MFTTPCFGQIRKIQDLTQFWFRDASLDVLRSLHGLSATAKPWHIPLTLNGLGALPSQLLASSQAESRKTQNPLNPEGMQGVAIKLSCPVRTRKPSRNKLENVRAGTIDADFDAVGAIPVDLLPLLEIWDRLRPDDRRALIDQAKRLMMAVSE